MSTLAFSELKILVLVFLGGGMGAVARWSVAQWVSHHPAVAAFPWHTFAINVFGSLILGTLAGLCTAHGGWWALLGVGFCGGFTTFSTFSLETVHLLEDDRPTAAIIYVAGSVLAAIAGAWLGLKIGK